MTGLGTRTLHSHRHWPPAWSRLRRAASVRASLVVSFKTKLMRCSLCDIKSEWVNGWGVHTEQLLYQCWEPLLSASHPRSERRSSRTVFSQSFHSFILEWWHHEVLIVEWDVGPFLLPWWHGIRDIPWQSGLFALRSHHEYSPLRFALVRWWEGRLKEVEPVCALFDLHLFGGR